VASFRGRHGPATAPDRFVTSLAGHKKDVQAVFDQANSLNEAAEELHRLTAAFAEELASSGMTFPSSLSLHDPDSYYQLFKPDHTLPYMIKMLEERKRASINICYLGRVFDRQRIETVSWHRECVRSSTSI
jgi:hypothetical protein